MFMWGVLILLCMWLMIIMFYVIVILLILFMMLRGKHGFMHLNNIKFPLFMLKVLKLHLFFFTMLVSLCFHDLFLYKIPMIRKWVRLKCALNLLLDALFYFNSYLLCEHILKLSCLT